jgi:hypothetical protein
MRTPADDPVKKRLQQRVVTHRQELETEFEELTHHAQKFLTHALVIGGALAVTFLVVKHLAGGKSKKDKSATAEPSPQRQQEKKSESALSQILTQVGTVLASQAAVFLLTMAREKLMAYLKESTKSEPDEHS